MKNSAIFAAAQTAHSFQTRQPAHEDLLAALARVPQTMKDFSQWVLWRIEPNKKGKPTKVPYIAGPGLHRASSTEPKTWRTFEQAVAVLTTEHGTDFSGIGFCLQDSGIAGVDCDDVLCEGGDIAPWAEQIVGELNTYAEISPSGKGVKAFVFGKFEGGGKKKEFSDGTGFEFYCRGRFFTVTGNQLAGAPGSINTCDCQALADRYARGDIGPIENCFKHQYKDAASTKANGGMHFDVAGFLKHHPISVLRPPRLNGGTTIYEIECQGSHGEYDKRDGRAFIAQLSNGAIFYGCLHKGCSDYRSRNHWQELRDRFEPDARRSSYQSPPKQEGKAQTREAAARHDEAPREAPSPQFRKGRLIGPINTIGDTLLAQERFAWNEGEKLHIFADGAYRDRGMQIVRNQGQRLMQQWGVEPQWKRGLAEEVHEWILLRSPELWERPPLDRINLRNGIFNLTTSKLEPHTSQWLSPIQLPIIYDPTADCPAWDEFLEAVVPADVYQARVTFELAALLMIPFTAAQKALLLQGPRGTGKSRYLFAMRSFLGDGNVSSKSLHFLEDNRFATAYLYGKLVNICADLPARHLETTSTFKAITGEDYIDAEYKHGKQFQFRPFARLLFSANLPPQSQDTSDAFLDRWWVVPFNKRLQDSDRQIAAEELDRRLAQPSELSGVLNRALKALPTVLSHKCITQTKSMRDAHNEFTAATDPFQVWVREYVIDDPEGIAARDEVRTSYYRFRRNRGLPAVSDTAFGLQFKKEKGNKINEGQLTVRGSLKHCYIGIRLKVEEN